MNQKMPYVAFSAPILLNGCELGDRIEREAKHIYNKIHDKVKEKYEKYRGEGQQDKPRPFEVVYQQDPSLKTPIILSQCNFNQPVQYVFSLHLQMPETISYDTQTI